MERRVCSRCLNEQDVDQFSLRHKGKPQRNTLCKTCVNEYGRMHYRNNQRHYIDRAAQRRKANRKLFRAIKQSTPCADCGQKYPYYVMDFDHVNGTKEAEISRILWDASSKKRVMEELAKCELVCANCHRMRTHRRLVEKGLLKEEEDI